MSVRRLVAGLLAMMLGAAVVSILPSSSPTADAAQAPDDSAVTVSGTGEFANLKVTVSQTKNLINQTVKVTWTGGAPTDPTFNIGFLVNYLQIMQCWGDDPAGPDRSQCQFGGLTALASATSTGRSVLSRQLNGTNDPAETLTQPAADGQVYVPFWVVGRDKPTGSGAGNINDFFDSQVTNEIPLARTRGDGTGEELFEIETVTQAAGLGCGAPVITNGVTTGRRCWLVIVPRGTKDADGAIYAGSNIEDGLQSSPLSQSNWDNRIVVPLEFQPVGQPCPLGAPERSLIGHELAVEAVSSWQPALCGGGGALFSYTQLPDDVARGLVQEGRLAVVNEPILPDQVPADHPLVYAPVGLSGLTVAFNINYQPPESAPPEIKQLKGRRFMSMKLTPRLVAKLITQSYRRSLQVPLDALKNNPIGLLFDTEFRNLNPEYKDLVDQQQPVPDALVQLNGADTTALLWRWVMADPDARKFLAGTPDEFGMLINPNNKNLPLQLSVFPRNDQSCSTTTGESQPPVTNCNLDSHPYANDMHDAGRAASRGDTLARQNVFDTQLQQAVSKKVDRQFAGRQGLIAVVDAATAARYGLPTAQLLNAAEKYVAPTPESMLASEAAMKRSAVAEVRAPDPAASDPAAYPLTTLSYAVTAPATLDAVAGKDYAAFLRYAGGPGQQQGLNPGQLPPGMVPLPDPLRAQTLAAATTIEKLSSQTPAGQPAPLPPPATTAPAAVPTQNPIGGPTSPAAPSGTTTNQVRGQPAATLPAVTVPGAGPPTKAPDATQQPAAGVKPTPRLLTPAVGALLLVILIAGGVAATSSPVMQFLSGVTRRRLREGVISTER